MIKTEPRLGRPSSIARIVGDLLSPSFDHGMIELSRVPFARLLMKIAEGPRWLKGLLFAITALLRSVSSQAALPALLRFDNTASYAVAAELRRQAAMSTAGTMTTSLLQALLAVFEAHARTGAKRAVSESDNVIEWCELRAAAVHSQPSSFMSATTRCKPCRRRWSTRRATRRRTRWHCRQREQRAARLSVRRQSSSGIKRSETM